MKRKNMARNALVTSLISLLLCVSMLVGTTFAWFTDEVKSGTNVIAAGNLDVELYHSNVKDTKEAVTGTTVLFDEVTKNLWEPGALAYENFEVVNAGTLALKYKMSLKALEQTEVNGYKLGDVIKVGFKQGGFTSTTREGIIGEVSTWTSLTDYALNKNGVKLLAKGTDTFGLVLYWQPNDNATDNHYNVKGEALKLTVGIELYATQEMNEKDSFDDAYDVNAEYPGASQNPNESQTPTFTVNTATQLQAAMQPTNSDGDLIINLAENIELAAGENWTPLSLDSYTGVARVVINGNGYTIKGLNNALLSSAIFGNTKVEINNLTLVNSTVESAGDYAGAFVAYADNAKAVTLSNCHVKNSTVSSNNYAGALLGYVAGSVTIQNCSVEGCTVTSGGSAGALAGMISTAQGSETATVSGVVVTGNTIISTKSGTYRVGELFGTTNIAQVKLSGITASGNACSQPGSTGTDSTMVSSAWIGRTSSQVEGDTSTKI